MLTHLSSDIETNKNILIEFRKNEGSNNSVHSEFYYCGDDSINNELSIRISYYDNL